MKESKNEFVHEYFDDMNKFISQSWPVILLIVAVIYIMAW